MKKLSLLFVMCLLLFSKMSFSQQMVDKSINGKYLIIDNFDDFFTDEDSIMVSKVFYLFNIDDSESSKPIYKNVYDNPDVVYFSLESRSGEYEMQRRCVFKVKKRNYKSTFMSILYNMDVKYIMLDGELKTIEEFYSIIK